MRRSSMCSTLFLHATQDRWRAAARSGYKRSFVLRCLSRAIHNDGLDMTNSASGRLERHERTHDEASHDARAYAEFLDR